jgi:hypothetical protein
MTMKRTSSTKKSIEKKQKLNTEDTIDYTKSLTSEDAETIEPGFEELDNVDNPVQTKTEIKTQVNKKKVPKTDKENKSSKKIKGKPNTKDGEYILVLFFKFVFV